MASTAGSSLRAAWRDCIGSNAPAAPTPSWQRKSRRELMGSLLNVPFSHRDLSVSADVAQRYWRQGASSVRRFASLTEDRPYLTYPRSSLWVLRGISGWQRSRSERRARATSNNTGPERSEGPLKPLTLP